jgi:hypothetical protein
VVLTSIRLTWAFRWWVCAQKCLTLRRQKQYGGLISCATLFVCCWTLNIPVTILCEISFWVKCVYHAYQWLLKCKCLVLWNTVIYYRFLRFNQVLRFCEDSTVCVLK